MTNTESFAAFLHNEFQVNENLTLNLGIRVTFDNTEVNAITSMALNDPAGDEDRVTPCIITSFPGPGAFGPACAGLAAFIPLPVIGLDAATFADQRHDTDERFLEATNQLFDKADDYWIVNARAAIASQDGKWELAVWGKNIFDEEYLSYINNAPFFKLDIFGAPASYGASLSYRFN